MMKAQKFNIAPIYMSLPWDAGGAGKCDVMEDERGGGGTGTDIDGSVFKIS